jgi:hypothetical protein
MWMRNILLAASVAAVLSVPGAASAQYYYDGGYAPPAIPYVAPAPGAYVAPAPGGPMVGAQVYLAPGPAPAVTVPPPGMEYNDQAIYIGGERYYRDCWWDWGQRRCDLKRWW